MGEVIGTTVGMLQIGWPAIDVFGDAAGRTGGLSAKTTPAVAGTRVAGPPPSEYLSIAAPDQGQGRLYVTMRHGWLSWDMFAAQTSGGESQKIGYVLLDKRGALPRRPGCCPSPRMPGTCTCSVPPAWTGNSGLPC